MKMLLKAIFSPATALVAVFTMIMLFGLQAMAQVVDVPGAPTTAVDVFQALAELVGVSVKEGAGTFAIVLAAAQLLSKFILSPLWDNLKLDPKYKFLVFSIVSLVMAIVPLMVQGASFVAALTSGAVLLLVMQYGHRIYELFVETKEA